MAKLPNAPLQEVIFEIRWELQVDSSGSREIDEGFELAIGKFQHLVSDSFPFYRRKTIATLVDVSVPYQVAHQFWSAEHTWPAQVKKVGLECTMNQLEDNPAHALIIGNHSNQTARALAAVAQRISYPE